MNEPVANEYIRQDLFAAKMELVGMSISTVRDELRSFKRFCTSLVVIGVPTLTAVVQLLFQVYGK